MDLISTNNFVESPFIIATFGDYTFGGYTSKTTGNLMGRTMNVTYPNFMKSLEVTKINGQVNTYNLKMTYAITENDDPNMLEKVFSSIKNDRQMILTYGDWNNPGSIYRKESVLITSIKSNVSMSSSSIDYTISGVSNSMTLNSVLYEFPPRRGKPSDIIKEILYSPSYGLMDIFTGMNNRSMVNRKNLIASDDKVVDIPGQSMGALDYIVYLVNCMGSMSESNDSYVRQSIYQLSIVDDSSNEMGGPYFQVKNIDSRYNIKSSESGWEIDVGYPGKNFVTNFEVDNDESWSILYDYQSKINQSQYTYRIDNDGTTVTEESPSLMRSHRYKTTKEPNRTWWTQMTQFPITARLTIKGLIRPTILMDYVKLNVLFYGTRHITSGVYAITKQVDSVSAAGYRTTLTLLRVAGDE